MRIRKTKTEYFTKDDDQHPTKKLDTKKLKYLRFMVNETVWMENKVNLRIKCGWHNWRKVSGVICYRRVPVRVKGKVHKTVVIRL